MHPAVEQAYARIFRWAECNPQASRLPGHIQRDYDLIERHEQASAPGMDQARDRFEIEQLREDIEGKASEYAWRRELEHQLAEYVHDVADLTGRDELHGIGERLESCRLSGTYGQRPDGGLIIAWDSKCGLVRLCPDESREESRRVDQFYNPAITEFVEAHPKHRAFYAVFSPHNYRQGDLARGKRAAFDLFKQKIIDRRVEYCPVIFKDGPACRVGKKPGPVVVRTDEKLFPNIKGALVVQEDPLSALGTWNVHQNVILLVKGRFDYAEVRRAWGWDVQFQEVRKDKDSISKAIRELIKYSAMVINEKAAIKEPDQDDEAIEAGEHGSAPGMIDWPADTWLEWWDAQQGFRRTRAYGCLYALHGRTWDAMTPSRRKVVIDDADLSDHEAARCRRVYCTKPWKEVGQDLPKKARERLRVKLRKAMIHGEGLDLQSVQWLGAISWHGGSYRVGLVPGDNFSGYSGRETQKDNWQTGPPPDF